MSGGKIWNTLSLMPSIENTNALVQLNLDFTLIKTEAPLEYRMIGQAISDSRRSNAEDGTAHRTARKLGCLFGQIVPETPQLVTAYGRRVSEILQIPGINPAGSEADGPFRDFVGADCTSLWAAATSGISALGVHLLACMLARDWDGPTATAIWVELVQRRSIEIQNSLQEHGNVLLESQIAARQEFSRKELEDWDTSVRSWLDQADKALEKQRCKFLLIAKNVSLSIGDNKDPYTNVIAAWTQAMVAMERHLEGISQQISDGAILKAISAWHLYPELSHFGSDARRIVFDDHLFTNPARMTLGLAEVACNNESRGIHWSLALSHLRYYGDPVHVESVEDRTRVTLSQFQVVILGSVLGSWGVRRHEQLDAIRWIQALWTFLKKTAPPKPFHLTQSGHTSWLAVLAEAADLVLSATGSDLERHQDYLNHGECWGRDFLVAEMQSAGPDFLVAEEQSATPAIQPYFGLCNPMVMSSLEEPVDVDAGIAFLRQLAKKMGLKAQDAIICYSDRKSYHAYYEYCTAVPHLNSQGHEIHACWIKARTGSKVISARSGRTCYHKCHQGRKDAMAAFDIDLDFRLKMIQSRGEACFILGDGSLHERTISVPKTDKKVQRLIWEHFAPLYQSDKAAPAANCLGTVPCHCLTPIEGSPDYVTFERYLGIPSPLPGGLPDAFEIYIRTDSTDLQVSNLEIDSLRDEAAILEVEPSEATRWLMSNSLQPNRVWDYIQSLVLPPGTSWLQLVMPEIVPTPSGLDWKFSHGRAATLINTVVKPPLPELIRSLELLTVISEVYQGLPGATISLGVLDYPISDGHWTALDSATHLKDLPGCRRDRLFGAGELLQTMERQGILSCIALMETGVSNIRPETLKEVIAMSFRNSIFVVGTLLSDPHESVPAKNVRHIVGNVGFAGLNLMVIPPGPLKIRPAPKEVQKVSRQSNFEAERKNKFHSTSLHLHFTGQRFPLVLTDIDTIDQGIFFLQSVVSLWDNGKHLVDLDILGIDKDKDYLTRITISCSCPIPQLLPKDNDIRCLDSWQDVMRPPRGMCILRAHGNWPARLAAVSLLLQQRNAYMLGILSSEILCWRCLEARFNAPEPHLPQILID